MTPLLTVKEAAARLSVSPALVYGLIQSGKIRHERHGLKRGVIRIPEDALEEYRRSREIGAFIQAPIDRSRPKLSHIRLKR